MQSLKQSTIHDNSGLMIEKTLNKCSSPGAISNGKITMTKQDEILHKRMDKVEEHIETMLGQMKKMQGGDGNGAWSMLGDKTFVRLIIIALVALVVGGAGAGWMVDNYLQGKIQRSVPYLKGVVMEKADTIHERHDKEINNLEKGIVRIETKLDIIIDEIKTDKRANSYGKP